MLFGNSELMGGTEIPVCSSTDKNVGATGPTGATGATGGYRSHNACISPDAFRRSCCGWFQLPKAANLVIAFEGGFAGWPRERRSGSGGMAPGKAGSRDFVIVGPR
jgi:hypothetical protein